MGNIADYLLMELESVYCGTCAYGEDYSQCDECDRKRMGWELSEKKAERMEARILEILSDELHVEDVEELEKLVPKKVAWGAITTGWNGYLCPVCTEPVGEAHYCPHCGQKLDWEEE